MFVAQIIPATRIALGRRQVFSYSVPAELKRKLRAGMVAEVPFGKRKVPGVVVLVGPVSHSAVLLKPVSRILWREPIVTRELFLLAKYISDYYFVSLGQVAKSVITKFAPRAKLLPKFLPEVKKEERFTLTEEQKKAVKKILDHKNKATTFLLHGVTGSGKTEVYLRVIEQLLKEGRQILILVPEIALTPQTLARFGHRFGGGRVAVVHSKISYGQKSIVWQKVFLGEIKILIGPRSAVFAPFKKLGLIVMDEEHDPSYKQFDQNPKFHARTAARKLSELWSCPLVLGDATPSVETYYAAEQGQIKKLILSRRIKQELPPVQLVDMREEARAGNFSIFSGVLKEKIENNLKRGLQAILFLNRRGTATSQLCRDCGRLSMCSRCEVPLVYHHDLQKLVCHHCGRRSEIPAICEHCASHRLRFAGTGTEKVEREIAELFPEARVGRFDRDTLTKKSEIDRLYHDFLSRRFSLLVGTQVLAKGWDLSHVGLIGAVNADTILSLPDFRSNERTFQLITQVAGRAGRGEFPGEVVVQTYSPENFAIKAAVKHDYQKFYEQEIEDRREFGYPPFRRLIKLTFKHTRQEKALRQAEDVVENLKRTRSAVEVIGPSPAFIPRVRGKYTVYVIIKLPANGIPDDIQKELAGLSPAWDIDVEPDSLL